MKSIQQEVQACDVTYVKSWENVCNWHKATEDLKQFFKKALALEYLEKTEAHLYELSNSIKAAISKTGAASKAIPLAKQPGSTFTRLLRYTLCNRNGHDITTCKAVKKQDTTAL
ncbi:hypothetical protein HK096_007882 [Nowakowskiella sp. JEL0078]|nr:hypothetical protein HK096_007882 [Nowakowskiella sp. JEL0078]